MSAGHLSSCSSNSSGELLTAASVLSRTGTWLLTAARRALECMQAYKLSSAIDGAHLLDALGQLIRRVMPIMSAHVGRMSSSLKVLCNRLQLLIATLSSLLTPTPFVRADVRQTTLCVRPLVCQAGETAALRSCHLTCSH